MRIGPADPVVNFKKQSYFLLRCRDFYIKLIRAAAGYKCLEGFDLTVGCHLLQHNSAARDYDGFNMNGELFILAVVGKFYVPPVGGGFVGQ